VRGKTDAIVMIEYRSRIDDGELTDFALSPDHRARHDDCAAANACAWAIAQSFFDRLSKADTSCARKVPATKFEMK